MTRIAAVLAALLLLAVPTSAQAPEQARGEVNVVVLWSDGTEWHPVGSGTLPLLCEPAP